MLGDFEARADAAQEKARQMAEEMYTAMSGDSKSPATMPDASDAPLPPVPTMAADFVAQLRELLPHTARLGRWLLLVAPSNLRSFIGSQLEPSWLTAVVPALAHACRDPLAKAGNTSAPSPRTTAIGAFKRLRALTEVPRFSIQLGLLDDTDREALVNTAAIVCTHVLEFTDKMSREEAMAVARRFA